MPKHTRSSSHSQNHGHNRYSNPMPESLGPAAPLPIYNTRPTLQMNTNYYQTIPSSASVQPALQAHAYDPYVAEVEAAPAPPMPHRPSSGAWSPQDDQNLLTARTQGLNWSQIQQSYFPNKTPNACRKRHERLLERKGADDWDTRKLERLAQEYMKMRKEIWQPLASKTGEKWHLVEAKCMNNGLKNLQSAARSANRRERLEAGQHPIHGYADDDSGISGIGLTPVDDLDASYSSPASASSSGGSNHAAAGHVASYGAAIAAGGYHPGYGTTAANYAGSAGGLSSSYSSSVSSTYAHHPHAHSHSHHHHPHHHQNGSSPYMDNGQRLPSVDMGIGAIINRPGGHNANNGM